MFTDVFMEVEIINTICAQAVRGLLGNLNEPVNELSYFDCIESVMENSKVGFSYCFMRYSALLPVFVFVFFFVFYSANSSRPKSNTFICVRFWASRWQVFLSTVKQVMCWPLEKVWAWHPKLYVGWQKLQDRWDYSILPTHYFVLV